MPSASGLTKAGNSAQSGDLVGAALSHREARRLHAGVAHQPLGHRLVETGAHRQRVGEQIRLIEQLAQRRDLRLARAALDPFGDGEHQIVAFARDQKRGESLAAADALDLAAQRLKRASELIDGLDAVELGHLLLGEAERPVVVAQIVDESDAHQACPVPMARSAPTVPSGSA